MNESLTYEVQRAGVSTRDRTQTLFAQTMGYVAVTAAPPRCSSPGSRRPGYYSLGTGQGHFFKELS